MAVTRFPSRHFCFLYLLLLMVICDAQPPDLTTQQKECLFRVDAHNFHHLVYDLNSLKNVDAAYEYTDENDGSIYEASFCDSFRLMRPHCPVGDAVGAKSGHCEYYGRSSSIEAVSHLNASDPRHGFVITYGNGMTCPSHPTLTNRISFVITCDWEQANPPTVFNNMYIKGDSCEHVFEFTSRHGCPHADSMIPGGRVVHMFFFALIVMLMYCSLGYVYNVKFKGASGIEAVPHIILLRKIFKSIYQFCLQGNTSSIGEVFSSVYHSICTFCEESYVYICGLLGLGSSRSTVTTRASTRRSSGMSQDKYAVLLSDMSEHGNVTSPMTTSHHTGDGVVPYTPGQAQEQKSSSHATSINSGNREASDRYDKDNDEISITLNDASL